MKKLFALVVVATAGGIGLPASAQTSPAAASAPAETAAASASAPRAPRVVRLQAEPVDAPKDAAAMSGKAAWYGAKFNGRKTASGQPFNAAALTAAHPSLPFGSRVKVTNTQNKRSVVVTINDRGPTTPGRIIDVSHAAAQKLGLLKTGTADVNLEVVGKSGQRRKAGG